MEVKIGKKGECGSLMQPLCCDNVLVSICNYGSKKHNYSTQVSLKKPYAMYLKNVVMDIDYKSKLKIVTDTDYKPPKKDVNNYRVENIESYMY